MARGRRPGLGCQLYRLVVINDELWLFTGHDEGGKFFTMHDWHCFSTKDMVNWTDHGSPLSVKDFGWAQDDAWAGQVIERNKKFYYFVPMTSRSGGDKFIGVAIRDTPEGPYKDAIGKPLIGVGWGNIDPTQFIDDDGQAYLYWGNPALKYVKLNQDMTSFDEKVGIVAVPLTIDAFGIVKRMLEWAVADEFVTSDIYGAIAVVPHPAPAAPPRSSRKR